MSGDPTNPELQPTILISHQRVGELLDLGMEREDGDDALLFEIKQEWSVQPGQQVGRYKLVRELGEGGFGIVWLAEQVEPFRREVALKLIKPGMDSRQVIARFEAERQTLAMMEHPNIAAVLDAGTTKQGHPFFAMELVRGVPITQYCDERKLALRERISLFLLVCQGVQHAHQKAILHRDLKPSNILVEEVDGRPKVIDFGIAKAVGSAHALQLEPSLMVTAAGAIIGTPQYMSPEQAGTDVDVDTRSDIYSLGAILYELLTGAPPVSVDSIRKQPLDKVLQIIREAEPVRPSVVFSDTSKNEAVQHSAEMRQGDTRKLSQELRGDLDWIVLKALDKDRNRRYESAAAFSDDLQRYLDDEPVMACPPTRFYVLRKLVRRNKGAFVSAALIILALMGGVSAVLWSLVRERKAQSRELEAEKKTLLFEASAKVETGKNHQISSFLGKLFNEVSQANSHTLTADAVRSLLKAFAERRQSEFQNQPEIDMRVSRDLANAFFEMNELDDSENLYQSALDRLHDLHKDDSLEAADCLFWLAWIRSRRMEQDSDVKPPDGQEELVQHCLGIRRKLLPPHHDDLIYAQALLATVLRQQGDTAKAWELVQKLTPDPQKETASNSPALGWVLRERALLMRQKGDFTSAKTSLDRAGNMLAMYANTTNRQYLVGADIYRLQSQFSLDTKELKLALDAAKKELEVRTRWLGSEDPAVLARIAEIYRRMKRLDDATSNLGHAIDVSRQRSKSTREELSVLQALVASDRQQKSTYQPQLLKMTADLAGVLLIEADQAHRAQKNSTDKLEDAEHLLEVRRSLVQPRAREAGPLFAAHASLAARRADYPAAVEDLRQAFNSQPDDYSHRFRIALFLLASGKVDEYKTERQALLRELPANTDPSNVIWICRAALLRPVENDAAALRGLQDKLVSISMGGPSENQLESDWVALLMGLAEYRSQNYEEASSWLDIAQKSQDRSISLPGQFLSAMDGQKLGLPEAQVELVEGEIVYDEQVKPLEGTDTANALDGFLSTKLLKDEADALVSQGQPAIH